MISQHDLQLSDGRTVRYYDTGPDTGADVTAVWHHGSPQTGALLDPLLTAAATRGIRLLSYGRPSYGGSSPLRGRDVASAAGDVADVVDAAGVDRFAVMGASGGGPHALACAARLGDRVIASVSLAGLAPFTDAFDWFAGMAAPGELRAAAEGRAARERAAVGAEFDESVFNADDWAALAGEWRSLAADAGQAGAAGPEGLVDDDLAFVNPWGFDVADIATPVLLAHGGADRVVPHSHSDWLLRACPDAELWFRPRGSHITILDTVPVAMDWLRAKADA